MIRIPSQVQRILSQVLGFLFVVSSTLFANWLWQKYTTEIEVTHKKEEERHVFVALVRKVISETEYNCTEGIGDTKCPFHLDAHNELLASTFIDDLSRSTEDLMKEILRLGGLCNGGRTNRKVTPAAVKTKSTELNHALAQLIAADTKAAPQQQ